MVLLNATVPFLFDKLAYVTFLNVFGGPVMLAAIGIFFIFILGLALRLSLEIQLLAMFFMLFGVIALMLPQIIDIGFVIIGIFVGVFLVYMLFRG
jgi:hypothetical protein